MPSLSTARRLRLAIPLLALAAVVPAAAAGPPRRAKGADVSVEQFEEANRQRVRSLPEGVKRRLETVKASVGIVRSPVGHGSGFVVAPGVLATNAHVVAGSLVKDLTVEFATPQAPHPKPLPMRLLYEDREADLALFAVETALPPLPLATAGAAREGVAVALVGNPGEFRDDTVLNCVSVGQCGDLVTNLLGRKTNYVKTTAYTVGGNSGGPAVCQESGAVVGVVTIRGRPEEGCPGYFLPAGAIATALKVVGPRAGWEKRAGAQEAVHAAAAACEALDGDKQAMNVRKLGDLAADFWRQTVEGRRPRLEVEGTVLPPREGIGLLKSSMERQFKAAKGFLEAAKACPDVPEKARYGLVEMVKAAEEYATLIGKPLKVALKPNEIKGYFNRMTDLSATIDKKAAEVRKALDEQNGK